MKTRNNSRYIPMTKNISLYYTIALICDNSKARITVILATIDEMGDVAKHNDIKKTISCSPGTEEQYATFVEQNKKGLYQGLLTILQQKSPDLFKKLGQGSNSANAPTFGEFYNAYWPHIVKLNDWKDSTQGQYQSTIKNQLAPLLSHKPMCELTQKDYDDAIDTLVQKRANDNKEYSKSRMDKFWSNLCSILEYACILGVCTDNPFQEHSKKTNPLERVKQEQFHRKSLTAPQALKVAEYIAHNFWTDSRIIGNAIPFFAGVRPAESGGFIFGDVVYFKTQPGRCYLAVHTQYTQRSDSEGNNHTSELKTNNGYRYIPVPHELQIMIEAKYDHLLKLGFNSEEISRMPIVNKPQTVEKLDNYLKHCSPRDISASGKHILSQTIGKRYIFEVPVLEENLETNDDPNSPKESILPLESDTQAYEMRRIFASRMYGICGLTLKQLQYVMGHTLDYEMFGRAYDYANEDFLVDIMRKMDRAITVIDNGVDNQCNLLKNMARSDPRKQAETIRSQPSVPIEMDIRDELEKHMVIQPSSENASIIIRLYLQAIEPDDKIEIHISGDASGVIVPTIAKNIGIAPSVTTNIQSVYLDEIFGDNVTTEEPSDDELDDNDDINDDSSIESYEKAWENHTEIEPLDDDD